MSRIGTDLRGFDQPMTKHNHTHTHLPITHYEQFPDADQSTKHRLWTGEGEPERNPGSMRRTCGEYLP